MNNAAKIEQFLKEQNNPKHILWAIEDHQKLRKMIEIMYKFVRDSAQDDDRDCHGSPTEVLRKCEELLP